MATHPEPTRPNGRHASLVLFDDPPVRPDRRRDLRALQALWDEENRKERRQRRLQRLAVRRATGLTPAQFRRGGAIVHNLILLAGVSLLFWMALGIIAAAFAGRL